MPVAKSDAELERRSASSDLRDDGARVTLVYEGEGRVDPITGQSATVVADRIIRTFALLTSYGLELVDGSNVQTGDLRVMLADYDLRSWGPALGEGATPDGYWIHTGGDPSRFPVPGAPGVRALRIVAVEQVVYIGGWPLLRFVRARG